MASNIDPTVWDDEYPEKNLPARSAKTNAQAAKDEIEALQASGSAPFADTQTIIKGSVDDTKLVRFEADGLTTGTTRVISVPDADFTMVGLDTAQTLTNKTLTSPTITSPTINTLATINGDINFSNANPQIIGGDVDGFLYISGGSALNLGTNFIMRGENHATQDGWFTIRNDTTINLLFNMSTWDFQAFDIVTTGNIELGHATDTTLSRSAAGVLAVEGVDQAAVTGANAAKQSFTVACSDEETALATGTAEVTFRMPYAFTLTEVRASVTTAPTGSVLTVDINETGATILSTKLTIDATEKTSTTAATPAVISDASLADDAEMTIDIDGVGSTVAGAGLKVTFIGYQT